MVRKIGVSVAALGIALIIAVTVATTVVPAPTVAGSGGRVYSVAQFVQPGTGPLWTTHRRAAFLIRGILRRVHMQPVADFLLSDHGASGTGMGGLALAAAPANPIVATLLDVPVLRDLLPHGPANPVMGRTATYQVVWIGCPAQGCAQSPWQLHSGGA